MTIEWTNPLSKFSVLCGIGETLKGIIKQDGQSVIA